MSLTGKNILITGGAGFIGSSLCHALVKENKIICLDNFLTGRRENIAELINHSNFKLIEGDIRNPEDCQLACSNIDLVMHQAALGSVPRSIENPVRTNEINISGFLNMLTAARDAGVKRFIYAASSSTYGDSTHLPKIENQIGKPLSPYAVSKYVNELYAEVFGSLYGLETIGLRYFNVFGRRQDPNGAYAAAIPKFILSFMKYESPVVHGDGSQSRDFTYIDNVVEANILAALTENKSAVNQVYNVAYGERTVLIDLIKKLQQLLTDFDPKIAEVPIKFGEERKGDVKHSLASVEKAKTLLNYNPKFDVDRGLEAAINWYWENLKRS